MDLAVSGYRDALAMMANTIFACLRFLKTGRKRMQKRNIIKKIIIIK